MKSRTRRIRRKRRQYRRVWRAYQAAVEHAVWCTYVPNNVKFSQIARECEALLTNSDLPKLEWGTTFDV